MDMKKLLTFAALGVALATAGCSKTENAGGTVKREAGNWKTDVKLVKFEVPGMPPEMKDGMAKMMEGASGMDQCFTQEQVDEVGAGLRFVVVVGVGLGGACVRRGDLCAQLGDQLVGRGLVGVECRLLLGNRGVAGGDLGGEVVALGVGFGKSGVFRLHLRVESLDLRNSLGDVAGAGLGQAVGVELRPRVGPV